MVQLYIKHTDNNYYLLDLEDTEAINFKLTVKDMGDITKIFSPFTQSFTLPATDKNKILCGFIGNEKIQRVNNAGEFDAKIYVSGFLFQSGKLSFDETDYELQEQKSFKTNFASNLTSLVDKLGDMTIQDLFKDANGNFDNGLKIDWNVTTLKDRLTSTRIVTLTNGVTFKYGIPFMSNNRVWTYDPYNLEVVDNIAYKATRTAETVNQISLNEVRPAVNYMSIMEHLLKKIGTPVTAPIFAKPEVKDLFVWCNSENLVVPTAAAFPLSGYEALSYLRIDTQDDADSVPLPSTPRWTITGGGFSGEFKVKRNEAADFPTKWSDGFDMSLTFNGLAALDAQPTKIKVILRNAATGVALDSQEITNNKYLYRITDDIDGATQLDVNGELYLKIEILPVTLVKWTSLTFKTAQKFRYEKQQFGFTTVTRATFTATAINNTDSSTLGGNKINLITCLPKMKAIDFLKSFFKTFNISVVSTGLDDQSMYWLTPSDILEVNKPYSKRIVDYTEFVDVANLNKKKGSQYNQYSFSHFASKYYDATRGDGSKFGELVYPTAPPAKPTKFEVKTDYSIIKQSNTFDHPSTLKTCLAFEKDSPTVLDNGGVRYKPVFEEFTLMYLKPKGFRIGSGGVSVEYSNTVNVQLMGGLEASFINPSNGKTLAFGGEDAYTDSLYLNYYKSFIELLLTPNTYQSEFQLTLPPNEIFLNFANLKQGESNIPTGFRAQNDIIISEQRYGLVDSAIDLTTGKTKLTLLNY